MEIKTEKELWDNFTDYDCGETGTEGIAYFNGNKNRKWVAVDDVIKTVMKFNPLDLKKELLKKLSNSRPKKGADNTRKNPKQTDNK